MASAKKSMNRPTGVTILAVLEGLAFVFLLLFGIFIAVVGTSGPIASAMAKAYGPLGGIIGILFILLSFVCLAVAYGLWKGLSWGWWVYMVILAIGILVIVVEIVTGAYAGVISLIIDAIIIYYMTRPGVKKWFGL